MRFIISSDTKEDAHSRPTSMLTTATPWLQRIHADPVWIQRISFQGFQPVHPADEWVAGGMPITKMMNIERRHGEDKPVIKKALVELDGAPFKFFEAHREEWAKDTCFVYPGAIQYYGPTEVCDITTMTLALEQQK